MGDGKRWFKVWVSILTDPEFDDIHNQTIGVWVRLGALIAAHGTGGELSLSYQQFLKKLHLISASEEEIQNVLNDLKRINVDIKRLNGVNPNENISVRFGRWSKYQVDWNTSERAKEWRKTQKRTKSKTVQDKKKKRREEEEEKKKGNTIDFIETLKGNSAYKGIDIERELAKMDAWLATPKGRGRKKTHAFVVNWLNKIDTTVPEQKKPWED